MMSLQFNVSIFLWSEGNIFFILGHYSILFSAVKIFDDLYKSFRARKDLK